MKLKNIVLIILLALFSIQAFSQEQKEINCYRVIVVNEEKVLQKYQEEIDRRRRVEFLINMFLYNSSRNKYFQELKSK